MGDLDRNVSFSVGLDTSGVDAGAAAYTAKVQAMGAAGAKAMGQSASAITEQSLGIARVVGDLSKMGLRYQETGQISTRALASINVQLKELTAQYGKTATAADQLSASERAALTAAQNAAKQATANLREYNDAQQEVRRQTTNWTSLGNAIEGLGGPLGRVATIGGGVISAFVGGWQTGRQLDEWLEKNVAKWKEWKEEAFDDIVAVGAQIAKLSLQREPTPPSLKELLQPIGAKGEETQFSVNLGMGLAAQGVKTIADTTAEVKQFRDAVGLLRVEEANFPSHTGLDKFLEDSKGKIEDWARAFQAAHQSVPADLQAILDALQAADAEITKAKTNTANIQGAQVIANQASELKRLINAQALSFKAPATDEISKAIADVEQKTTAAYQALDEKATKYQQDLDLQKATYRELAAEIAKLRETGAPGPALEAQIAQLQSAQAVTLKRVAADKDDIAQIEQQRGKVQQLGEALRAIEVDNALAKMAEEGARQAQRFAEIIDGIRGEANSAVESLRGLPSHFSAPAQTAVSALFKDYETEVRDAIEAGFSDADLKAVLDQLHLGFKDASQVIVDQAKAAAEAFTSQVKELGDTLGNVFIDLAQTGGQNFGQIASQSFYKGVKDGSQKLAELFGTAVQSAFGGAPDQRNFDLSTKEGQDAFKAAQVQSSQQQQAIMGAFTGAVGMFGQILQEFDNAKKGQQTSVIGSAVSFGLTGASVGALFGGIGGIIGALAGAIIGAVTAIAANAKAKKEQPYAAYGIRNGQAYVEAFPGQEAQFQNITATQYNDMIRQMNSTVEEFTNGYVKLLLKFPLQIISGLSLGIKGLDFAPTMAQYKDVGRGFLHNVLRILFPVEGTISSFTTGGAGARGSLIPGQDTRGQLVAGGQIGNPNYDNAARTNFLTDFDNWVKNILPPEIAAKFEAQTAKSFEAMGVTEKKFDQIWKGLQGQDPKEALQTLNDLADAVISFSKIGDFSKGIEKNFAASFKSGGPLNAAGLVRAPGVSDFEQSLIDSQEELAKEAIAIHDLVGADQVTAAKALGESLTRLQQNLVEFLNNVTQISASLSKSIEQQRFQLKLDAATSPQAKSDLLFARLQKETDEIRNAASLGLSPEEVQSLVQDATSIVNQLYQLDPTKRNQWADSQLAQIDEYQKTALKALGDQARQQFQDIVDAMKPAIDFFEGIPDTLTTPIDDLGAAAENAANKLNGLGGGAGAGSGQGKFQGNGKGTEDLGGDNGSGAGTGNGAGAGTSGAGYNPDLVGQAGGLGGSGRPTYSGGRPAGSSSSPRGAAVTGAAQSAVMNALVASMTQDAFSSRNPKLVSELNQIKQQLAQIARSSAAHLAVAQDGRDVRVTTRVEIADESGSTQAVVEDDGFQSRVVNSRGRR